MPIDTSIYSNIKPVQMDLPQPMQIAQQAMALSQLGMQQRQMQYQMGAQMATRQAFADNTDKTGQVNKEGALSQLSRAGYGQQSMALGQQFAAQEKAEAEAKKAQGEAASTMYNITGPAFDYMHDKVSKDQLPTVYPQIIQGLKAQGIDVSAMDHPFDQQAFDQYYGRWQNSKESLANQAAQAGLGETKAKTAEAWSNVATAPAKLNSELYGSRSPNAELSSQYSKDVGPIRNSQLYMNQMLDSYKKQTPQGDAALVLNNFKIRNPGATDVNSIEEMKSSQSVSDAWRNKLNEALNGGMDKPTRDNLIRDGVSAFRANYNTYQGVKDRYQARQAQQNVNDPTLTYEPAIEKTYKQASALQDQIGDFVPATKRGLMGSIGNMVGLGGEKSATASDKPTSANYSAGSIVMVKGKHYTVGPDGDSLVPVKGKR